MKTSNKPSPIGRRTACASILALLTFCMISLGDGNSAYAKSAQQLGAFSIIPNITGISLNEAGDLVASGEVTAVVKGQTITSEFEDVPVSIALAADQTGAGECPILDLTLGPINLNLLGLVVETSEICLKLTAYENGGLLGDLLCEVGTLLEGGGLLGDILGDLVLLDVLLDDLQDLLNGALTNLAAAEVENIQHLNGRTCGILDLALGPVDLTLLGLNVHLDDCEGGPVTVEITGDRSQLLGRLLCGLLHDDVLAIGDTLQDILDGLANL